MRTLSWFHVLWLLAGQAPSKSLFQAVVLPTGAVGDVRVSRSLDPDLDQSAMAELRQWQFSPSTVSDKPVPTLVDVEMSFAINPALQRR